jgi:hypothetical protein
LFPKCYWTIYVAKKGKNSYFSTWSLNGNNKYDAIILVEKVHDNQTQHAHSNTIYNKVEKMGKIITTFLSQ